MGAKSWLRLPVLPHETCNEITWHRRIPSLSCSIPAAGTINYIFELCEHQGFADWAPRFPFHQPRSRRGRSHTLLAVPVLIQNQTYLARIAQINPDARDIARRADEQRSNGKDLGLVSTEDCKSLFLTNLVPYTESHSWPRTCFAPWTRRRPLVSQLFKESCFRDQVSRFRVTGGCLALAKSRPLRESTVVIKLRDNGAILLGKTDLSEWANFRGPDIPDGWSSMGGQSYAPYCFQQDPTGSSSGSAIAVATGLCAFALGIEVGYAALTHIRSFCLTFCCRLVGVSLSPQAAVRSLGSSLRWDSLLAQAAFRAANFKTQ